MPYCGFRYDATFTQDCILNREQANTSRKLQQTNHQSCDDLHPDLQRQLTVRRAILHKYRAAQNFAIHFFLAATGGPFGHSQIFFWNVLFQEISFFSGSFFQHNFLLLLWGGGSFHFWEKFNFVFLDFFVFFCNFFRFFWKYCFFGWGFLFISADEVRDGMGGGNRDGAAEAAVLSTFYVLFIEGFLCTLG